MTWEQVVLAAVIGLPGFFWRFLERQDKKSEVADKKKKAEDAVTSLTLALAEKDKELQMKDKALEAKDEVIEAKDRTIAQLTDRVQHFERMYYERRPE